MRATPRSLACAASIAACVPPAFAVASQGSTLAEVAQVYMAVDAALAAPGAPASDADWVAANAAFDRASLAFLGSGWGEATALLWELCFDLRGLEEEARAAARGLATLRLSVSERMGPELPALSLTGGRPVPAGADVPTRARIAILAGDDVLLAEVEVELTADAERRVEPRRVRLPSACELHRALTFEVRDPEGRAYGSARWSRLPGPAADTRAALLAAADAGAGGELGEARAVFESRVALLRARPDGLRSIDLLTDAAALYAELVQEAAAIADGVDPYVRRSGGIWTTYPAGRARLPVWTFAPAPRSDSGPVPLVIALHGAGGDESFFARAVEGGLLPRLASERGFLLALPRTPDLVYRPEVFDALLAELGRRYSLDPARVFVVGHSMGGMTAAVLTRLRPDALTKAVCIAGGERFGDQVPVLAIAGALDPIVPAAGLRRGAERARELGHDVVFEELAGGGHTLILGCALRRAVDFFQL